MIPASRYVMSKIYCSLTSSQRTLPFLFGDSISRSWWISFSFMPYCKTAVLRTELWNLLICSSWSIIEPQNIYGTCIGHVFKSRLFGDTIAALPQSVGRHPGSSSQLFNIVREGVIEQCLPPGGYGSVFRNLSNPWTLELVDTTRMLSWFSLVGLPRFRILIRCNTYLLGTSRAWMEGHGHEGHFTRTIALLVTHRTRCRRWQGFIHGWRWWGGGQRETSGCFQYGLLWWFYSSSRHVSGGRVWLWRCLSSSDQVTVKFVIHILEIIRYIWELVVCSFHIWWIISDISMAPRERGISLPAAEMRTWMKGVVFQYTHLRF